MVLQWHFGASTFGLFGLYPSGLSKSAGVVYPAGKASLVSITDAMFYGGNVVCVPVHFFSLPLIFPLVTASISHFLTAAIKLSCFSSKEIGVPCFFISRFRSFSRD